MLPRATLLVAVLLAGCAVSTPATEAPASTLRGEPTRASWGPGDLCAETTVIVTESARTNLSLGSENVRNGDACAAYPYLTWLLANDPLFTGGAPDDRSHLRLATVYEAFAEAASASERRAYLDSALVMRRTGRAALDAAGIAYDAAQRDLIEGYFFHTYAADYPDAVRMQYHAFNRALDAEPEGLSDWHLGRLLEASVLEFGDAVPNPQRAAYVDRLAAHADDASTREAYLAYAVALRSNGVAGRTLEDVAVLELASAVEAGSASCQQVLQLLQTALADPDRLAAAGLDADALQATLVRDACVTDGLDAPRVLLALAFEAFREGDETRGAALFDRAIETAGSDADRADYLYLRAARGYGDRDALVRQALRADPSHAQSLFVQIGQRRRTLGQPTDLEGRINYWCLADQYRDLAGSTDDAAVRAQALAAASGLEASGPTQEQTFFAGLEPGEAVACSVVGGATRVR